MYVYVINVSYNKSKVNGFFHFIPVMWAVYERRHAITSFTMDTSMQTPHLVSKKLYNYRKYGNKPDVLDIKRVITDDLLKQPSSICEDAEDWNILTYFFCLVFIFEDILHIKKTSPLGFGGWTIRNKIKFVTSTKL